MNPTQSLIPAMVCALLLAGCGNKEIYTKESFAIDSPFQKKLAVRAAAACESARRALLSQGYVLDSEGAEQVRGRKAYKADDDRSTFIEMNVVCVTDIDGSTLYANGMLSTYDVKKTSSDAKVGIKAVGSVSLPFGRSSDSMVKIADETINDKDYYQRFFTAVDHIVGQMQAGLLTSPADPLPPAMQAEPLPFGILR